MCIKLLASNIQQMFVAIVQDSDMPKKEDGRRKRGDGSISLLHFYNLGDLWVPWGNHELLNRWGAAS